MASSARSVLAPGTRFGRYEVLVDLASGGMAMVYLGRALGAAGFSRQVAIKVMHPQFANDDDFVGMFLDEARLAARIRHPNVVATLDLENDDDGLYLVMEFIEGEMLLGLMRQLSRTGRKMPLPIALRIVLDMLSGLHAAHELTGDQGQPLRLVHRDVSPHNVMVGVDGISRITDFGIARAEERLSATRDGQVKGKLAYMAPEQTTDGAVDRRVDVFATGVVLWECLTGKRLFGGQSDGEVLRSLLLKPIPSPREVLPDLPAALEEVCLKALARNPDERYASAHQMADALEAAGGSAGIASTRAVAQFVRDLCGDSVAALQKRVRATGLVEALNSGDTAVRKSRRREQTDPERTTQHLESALKVTGGDADAEAPVVEFEATTVSAPPAPILAAEPAAAPKPAGRSPAVPAALLGVLLLLGVGGVALSRRGAPRAPAPPLRAAQLAPPPPPVVAPPPAVAPPPPPEPVAVPAPPPVAPPAPPPVVAAPEPPPPVAAPVAAPRPAGGGARPGRPGARNGSAPPAAPAAPSPPPANSGRRWDPESM